MRKYKYQPSCEGVGELLFGGLPEESSPLLLELLMSHGCPCQLISALETRISPQGPVQASGGGVGLIRNGVFNFSRNMIIASCWM
jgi:hypothetical protein